MKRSILVIAALLIMAIWGNANAALVTFEFTNYDPGSGNTGNITVGGYTLQVQAWTAQHNTGTNPWGTTSLPGSSITWSLGQGLGVSNSVAGTAELDTNLYNNPLGYQDWLSFKLLNTPAGQSKYTSVRYYGLDTWGGNNAGDFSQARISTQSGGVLQGGVNPLGGPNSTDQLGLAGELEDLALPANFINGDWYLLVGPRLSGINNSGIGGAGDSFRVAAITMDIPIPAAAVPIPGAIWLLGSGLVGLVGLRRKIFG